MAFEVLVFIEIHPSQLFAMPENECLCTTHWCKIVHLLT